MSPSVGTGMEEAWPVDEMSPDELVFALLSSPAPADPYPLYAKLQEIAPRHMSAMGMRFVSRYPDVLECLRNPALHMAVAELMAKADPRYEDSYWLQTVEDMLIFSNPPKHTRIRSILNRAFTPRMVERLHPRIHEIVEGHLDVIEEKGECDLIAELAGVLPCEVICEMLGVPLADQAQVEAWTADIGNTVRPVVPDEALAAADRSVRDFHEYLRTLIADRRRTPRDDLITAMVQAEDQGHRLNSDELVSFAVTLLGAGTETTTNLVGVGTMALLQNPDQLAALRADPSLMEHTIEELLRLESPVQSGFPRFAVEDTTVGGEPIAQGEIVMALIAAANNDPDVFPEPHEFRIDRPMDRPHIAFGSGPHFCIGSALARVEGATALSGLLLRRFPNLQVIDDGALTWRQAFTLRGVEELWISVR